ncbi:MAG: hypothetical protein BEU01_00600 [Marine Group III euryarchaeote CG-Epi4]|uniref:Oxoglutarate/iron-dependent oxygenase C-terminal degradation domain-containing protein n=1 Tax=Marine Group III euryarchaeote CG-Epi4 TaxID=1888998 RepID=A0A1J5TX99_9ARCH|nr:MAG: hypothetical protein BEU01_00600 [Marine Group III euryarchaeote CG-Epi4]|tara:strand:+ start:1874 stop:2428 length:555 start_codon:yes stop_codon:yes gene_type:complete
MSEINHYYLEKPTLSNLNRIFGSADIPFIRLSKFLSNEEVNRKVELKRDEKIGFYRRDICSAYLGDFWKSKDFLSFLEAGTGLTLKFRSSQGQVYSPGDYSLLHSEEFEKKRLVVVYDLTNSWNVEWGGHDIYTSPDKDPLICNRDSGTLMLTLMDEGDYSCTRYVSLKSDSKVVIDKVIFDLK